MQPVVDFETLPIIDGSGRHPRPVGVSVWVPGEDNVYIGWGHPGDNPHTWEDGRKALGRVWEHRPVFHNAKFDCGVALEHMEMPWPLACDDTMIQAFLVDPLAPELGLKPLAHKYLGMPPEEKDAVYRWLRDNFHGPFVNDHKMITPSNAGAYISYVPYDIVAPYACGDTARTIGLHGIFRRRVTDMGMDAAYARELALTEIGYWMERFGVRVDRDALARDYEHYLKVKAHLEIIVNEQLGIDAEKATPRQLAAALIEGGHVDSLPRTPSGKQYSTAKATIETHVKDPALAKQIRHKGILQTLTGNFYKNWLAFSADDGRVHPSWNQVRNERFGARTGRFSCSEPNFQNVPTEFPEGYDVPYMRKYILPDEGCIIVPADYNGQEMRGLAHYAEGPVAEVYRNDPRADFHAVASRLVLEATGLKIHRKMAKIVGFSLIYGSGIQTLADQLTAAGFPTSYEQAKMIKAAYFRAFPGLQQFIWLFRDRNGIRTWGGRWLPCEPPREIDGVVRDFHYKLVNYLIQGSAADQTKEAIVRHDRVASKSRMMMTVHDELVISVPLEYAREEIELLKWSMEEMPGWDVPFVAEIEYGANWHELKAWAQ